MNPTPTIKKSVVLLASVAALVAPTAATAYPVIGDDPTTPQAQNEGRAWWDQVQKRRAAQLKPSNVKPNILCPGKTICRKP